MYFQQQELLFWLVLGGFLLFDTLMILRVDEGLFYIDSPAKLKAIKPGGLEVTGSKTITLLNPFNKGLYCKSDRLCGAISSDEIEHLLNYFDQNKLHAAHFGRIAVTYVTFILISIICNGFFGFTTALLVLVVTHFICFGLVAKKVVKLSTLNLSTRQKINHLIQMFLVPAHVITAKVRLLGTRQCNVPLFSYQFEHEENRTPNQEVDYQWRAALDEKIERIAESASMHKCLMSLREDIRHDTL